MPRSLFGTDGVRGRANSEPMTAEIAMRIGMAAGLVFNRGGHRHRVVVGKDTRLSGYMIERVVSHGKRRAAEMREVADTLEGIGLEPIMAAASAARQQWIADLGVKERLKGGKTEDRAELVRAIREAMGK